MENSPKPDVTVGRLQKRIAKLQQQRDHFRHQCEVYREVMQMHPHLEYSHKRWAEERAERERVRGLEDRIKEQAALIKQLLARP
jgi:flagellar biosynthesis chaperone FliJ